VRCDLVASALHPTDERSSLLRVRSGRLGESLAYPLKHHQRNCPKARQDVGLVPKPAVVWQVRAFLRGFRLDYEGATADGGLTLLGNARGAIRQYWLGPAANNIECRNPAGFRSSPGDRGNPGLRSSASFRSVAACLYPLVEKKLCAEYVMARMGDLKEVQQQMYKSRSTS